MWWHDLDFLFVCLLFLHLMIFKKVWLMLLGFSCDGTCLSWIEFIFDLSMWASIFVYLFGVIMRIWWCCCIHLCYDIILFYDDNSCTLYDVDALLYNMMCMHTIVWWLSPMTYDVYLMLKMHTWCTLRWWWCIFDDEDAYPMMMMNTYDYDVSYLYSMIWYNLWW